MKASQALISRMIHFPTRTESERMESERLCGTIDDLLTMLILGVELMVGVLDLCGISLSFLILCPHRLPSASLLKHDIKSSVQRHLQALSVSKFS